jgi:hypothetical protein
LLPGRKKWVRPRTVSANEHAEIGHAGLFPFALRVLPMPGLFARLIPPSMGMIFGKWPVAATLAASQQQDRARQEGSRMDVNAGHRPASPVDSQRNRHQASDS